MHEKALLVCHQAKEITVSICIEQCLNRVLDNSFS